MIHSQEEKKVLMISYIFPPLGSGANQRTVRFVKYLGNFGWTPIVLTVKNGYYHYSDDYFLKVIPKTVRIYRTFSFEPACFELYKRPIKSAVKTLIRILLGRKAKSATLDSKDSLTISAVDTESCPPNTILGGENFYRKIKRVFDQYLHIPDGKIGWLPFAALKGIEIIYREKPSLIWANADRPSALLLGCLLKIITRRKLILNFSDPWVLSPYYPFDRQSPRARVDSFLEMMVIRKADRIVFATYPMQLDYEKAYKYESGKFCTILNGYDPDEFKEITSSKTSEKFTLTYCGSLQFFRSPEPLLTALESLIEQCPEYLTTLLVRFVGKVDQENLRYFRSFKHQAILHLTGQVGYQESLKYVLQSDVCLIITGNRYLTEMTGKVFEYMAAKKPILVISQKSEVGDLVESLKVGIVVRPDNIPSIQSALLRLVQERGDQSFYKSKERLIERYSRKSLTGELAACFDNLMR